MATSLIVPVAYITVLVTALAIFSRVYRRRKAVEKTSFEPWFPSHPHRDVYISLISASPSPPDSMLKSALLVRATADVRRIWRLRDDKMALTNLHQRGLIGDDTMARFATAEKELEAEIVDVIQEANTFRQGWGQMIFGTATEMAQAEKTREVVMSIPKIKMQEDRRQEMRKKYLPSSAAGPSNAIEAEKNEKPAVLSTPNKTAPPTPAAATMAPTALASASAASSGLMPHTPLRSRSNSPSPASALLTPSGSGSASGTPSKTASGKKKKNK